MDETYEMNQQTNSNKERKRNTRSKSNSRKRTKSRTNASSDNFPESSPTGNFVIGKNVQAQPPSVLPKTPKMLGEAENEDALSCADKLVIYTLWTSEVLFIIVSAWVNRFTEETSVHTRSGHKSYAAFVHDVSITTIICIVTLLAGLLGDLGRRFQISLSGVYVFSLTPAFGMLSLLKSELKFSLTLLRAVWYASVPCRLGLVFHQKFPLPVHDTHNIVTINELLIEVSEWLCVVFIEGSKTSFSSTTYLTVWSLTLCAAIGYSVATNCIRNSVNKLPSDIEFVREVYRTTEVINSFENRQASLSKVVFLSILYSGGIFTVVKEFLNVSILQLSRIVHYPSFGGIVEYRLDLIVSVLTMILVEFQLSSLKMLRDEARDLVLIAFAHLVNIVVLVLLLVALNKSEHGFLATEKLNFGSLEFFYPVQYHPFFLECDGETIKSVHPTVSGFGLLVDGQRDVTCRGWRSKDDLLFNESVTVRENLRTVYLIKKPSLVRVESFESWNPVPATNIVLMNAVDFCATDNNKLNLSRLCSRKSVCLSLQVEMISRSAENKTLFTREIHLPRVYKTSDFIALPKRTAEIEIRYNHTETELRKLMNVSDGKFKKPISWPMRKSFFIGPHPTIIVLLFFTYPKIACLPFIDASYLKMYFPDTEMIAPSILMGIAWGVAAVGYTHFMWIQSPAQWKTSMIAVYCVQHFLFTWVTRNCLPVGVGTATSVLVIQCFSTLVHIAFTWWFNLRLPTVDQEQLKRKGGRRF